LIGREVRRKEYKFFKSNQHLFTIVQYELPPVMAAAKYGALFPHVAGRGKDLLHILVHGAANLPFVDGRQPRCYVTA
jgi:hypothetical protein